MEEKRIEFIMFFLFNHPDWSVQKATKLADEYLWTMLQNNKKGELN
jgi:hypothetical protein